MNLRDKYVPKREEYENICKQKWQEKPCDLRYLSFIGNTPCCASDTIICKNKKRKFK